VVAGPLKRKASFYERVLNLLVSTDNPISLNRCADLGPSQRVHDYLL